jgi:hypothetical protein
VLCPATPTPTFPHDHTPMATRELDIDGQKRSYFDQLVWAGPATLNGLLVTTAPIRRTDTGLPIGVPIIDGFLDDRTTIAFAGMVAREFGGLTPPRCCNRPTRRRPGTTAAAAGVDWTGARCSAAGERWTYCVSSAPVDQAPQTWTGQSTTTRSPSHLTNLLTPRPVDLRDHPRRPLQGGHQPSVPPRDNRLSATRCGPSALAVGTALSCPKPDQVPLPRHFCLNIAPWSAAARAPQAAAVIEQILRLSDNLRSLTAPSQRRGPCADGLAHWPSPTMTRHGIAQLS